MLKRCVIDKNHIANWMRGGCKYGTRGGTEVVTGDTTHLPYFSPSPMTPKRHVTRMSQTSATSTLQILSRALPHAMDRSLSYIPPLIHSLFLSLTHTPTLTHSAHSRTHLPYTLPHIHHHPLQACPWCLSNGVMTIHARMSTHPSLSRWCVGRLPSSFCAPYARHWE